MEPASPLVGYVLLFIVIFLFALFAVVSFLFHIRPVFTAEVVSGMKFRFMPLQMMLFRPKWSRTIDKDYIEHFLHLYEEKMPEAYALLGEKLDSAAMRKHLKTVKVIVRDDFLSSEVRSAILSEDLNGDGKADKLTGLCHAETSIEVACPLEFRDPDGNMDVKRTALLYEIHNCLIWRFAGYEVAIGEKFVPPGQETALLPFLNGKKLSDMKKKRQILDEVYNSIKRSM